MPCQLSRWRLCIGQPSAGDVEGQNEKEKEGAEPRSEYQQHCAFAFQGMFGHDFTPYSSVEGASGLKWKLYPFAPCQCGLW